MWLLFNTKYNEDTFNLSWEEKTGLEAMVPTDIWKQEILPYYINNDPLQICQSLPTDLAANSLRGVITN